MMHKTIPIIESINIQCFSSFMRHTCKTFDSTAKCMSNWMWQGPKPKVGIIQPQKFDYLLVLDFEATCGAKGYEPKPQEIIEFPCALLNTKKGFKIEAIFHKYVRPIHNPQLSNYCTELTGITQVRKVYRLFSLCPG